MKRYEMRYGSFYDYLESMCIYLDSIEDLLMRIENKMDKKIKTAKKSMDKKMDALVKADVKRDKACDSKMMMKKKKK